MQTNGITHMEETKPKKLTPIRADDAVIYVTTEYDVFKGVIGNRPVYQPHLIHLITSIEKLNLLRWNPILVNEKMEVIDGQHRLLAAKALHVGIYYMIIPNAALAEIQLLNANLRAWQLEDYLDSYMAMGKKDYVRLKEFSDEYKISVSIALSILSGELSHRGRALQAFKDGKFVIKNMEEAERMVSLLVEIRRFSPDQAWVDRDLMRALDVMVKKNIDPKLLIKQLEEKHLAVTRRTSIKEYLHELQDILNFGQSVMIELY